MIGLLLLRLLAFVLMCRVIGWIFGLVAGIGFWFLRVVLYVIIVVLGIYFAWIFGAFVWFLLI